MERELRINGCKWLSFGGASRDRTDDLIVANDALSQLSYSPTVWRDFVILACAFTAIFGDSNHWKLKFTLTVSGTSTASPARNAGINRHSFTASSAASCNAAFSRNHSLHGHDTVHPLIARSIPILWVNLAYQKRRCGGRSKLCTAIRYISIRC